MMTLGSLFDGIALPCVAFVLGRIARALELNGMLREEGGGSVCTPS